MCIRDRGYCARLRALGALDFDDLLTEALKLDTAGRRGFSHLLVDEFQDINDVQYALVLSLIHILCHLPAPSPSAPSR